MRLELPATIPRIGDAPPGSLGAQAWADSLNYTIVEGRVTPRNHIRSFGLGSPSYSYGSAVDVEVPLLILTSYAPGTVVVTPTAAAPCGSVYSVSQNARWVGLVTSRHIWVYNDNAAAWLNCTPTYTAGTITATNGSVNITGAGTAWSTRGLSPYQWIQIDSVWYQICNITSDTALTLTSAFGGATGAGKAYTIRRTWDLTPSAVRNEACLVSATAYNQTLYVAGRFIGRADGQVAPAVIAVTGAYGATPTSNYLTASTALTAGLDYISTLSDITGIQALQDGRIVISGCDSVIGPSVIFYSSPTDQAVWTVTPGGFTSVTLIEGAIHALGRIGETLTLHYSDGVVLARPTNISDPPLSFGSTAATMGCFAPHTLRSVGGQEIFVTADGAVARFDQVGSAIVSDSVVSYMKQVGTLSGLRSMFAHLDRHRTRYQLFWERDTEAGSTRGLILDIKSGTWWPTRYPVRMTAASNNNPDSPRGQIIGVRSVNGDGTELANILYSLSERATNSDDFAFTNGESGGFWLSTDDLDFGDALRYKSPVRVVVWYLGFLSSPTSETVQCSISVDGGASWTASAGATATLTATKQSPIAFSFLDIVSASGMLRVRIQSATLSGNDACGAIPTRVVIEVNDSGDLTRAEL